MFFYKTSYVMKHSKLILTVTASALAIAAFAATKARTNRTVCTKSNGANRNVIAVCTVPGGTDHGAAKCLVNGNTAFSHAGCNTTLVTATNI